MDTIREPARDVPVVDEVDICVVGGSCTGVFAAVAAARLGCEVALIEQNGFFGGMATAALVSIWHSIYDTEFKQRIIGGLTTETVERLKKRDAVHIIERSPHQHFVLHTDELIIELDQLLVESAVRPFLHARFVQPHIEDGIVKAAVIETFSRCLARVFKMGVFPRGASVRRTSGDIKHPLSSSNTRCARRRRALFLSAVIPRAASGAPPDRFALGLVALASEA